MAINPNEVDFEKNQNIESDMNNSNSSEFVESASQASSQSFNENSEFLPSPMTLLSEAWQLYRLKWKIFLKILIVPILLLFLLFIVFSISIFIIGFLGYLLPGLILKNIIIFVIGLVLLIFLFLIATIIQFWSQTALIHAIKWSDIGVRESYRRGWYKVKSLFWVSILSCLVMLGGYIIFVIPGIIFSIWFILVAYVVVLEDSKGINAMLTSRELIRNYWWSVFWRILFISIFVFVIIVLPLIFSQIFSAVVPSFEGGLVEGIINFSVNIISLILAPFTAIYLFLIYSKLKKIKENSDLEESRKGRKSFIIIGLLGIFALITVASGMLFAFFEVFEVIK